MTENPYGSGQNPGGYPPPPPQPYAGYPPPPPNPPKNGLGLAALVVAIVGLVLCWSVVGGVIAGVVAVILGFLGRGRVKRGEADNGGIAIAGIVLGFLSIVVGLVFIAIWVGVFNVVGGGDFVSCMRDAGSDSAAQQKCADQFQRNVENRLSITLTPTS